MTSATVNPNEIAAFWRVARRQYIIYAELNRTFEIGLPPCLDLDSPSDRSDPEVLLRVRNWFDQMDSHVQVWQLRQLLQSTNLQTEENLGDLIARHTHREEKTDIDRDKTDFLLVQYFAHCAPHGLYEDKITLGEVARVLAPVVGSTPLQFPQWATELDSRLERLNECSSLEELQDSGALVEVRELKLGAGPGYFEPASLIAFTRFNFLARRAFFRAMHLDLHAIHEAVNELETLGVSVVDCNEAGLSNRASLEHIRHLVHQWKTPFRAPYSGGSSFLQLIQLRHVLDLTLDEARNKTQGKSGQTLAGTKAGAAAGAAVKSKPAARTVKPAGSGPLEAPADKKSPIAPEGAAVAFSELVAFSRRGPSGISESAGKASAARAPESMIKQRAAAVAEFSIEAPSAQHGEPEPGPELVAIPVVATVAREASITAVPVVVNGAEPSAGPESEKDYLQQCVDDITSQLKAAPLKARPSPSTIVLGGCKLLIATWESSAFATGEDDVAKALRGMVGARTILQVAIDRHKKKEPTDMAAVLGIAQQQVQDMAAHIAVAKAANDVDAAVNLAATTKRTLAMMEEAKKLR
jgi:hypothetical protein